MIPFPISHAHPHSMANFPFSFPFPHCCIAGVPCEGIFTMYNILRVFILELEISLSRL
jgi:hypothetical protein